MSHTTIPVPTGRGPVTGTIFSTRYVRNAWGGGAVKTLLSEDRDFRLWGTLPATLVDVWTATTRDELIERHSHMTATIEPSDDPGFGYFSRHKGHPMRLTANQTAALRALAEHSAPAAAGAIAEQVGKTLQGISTSLGSLSRRGLVERTQRAGRVTFTLTAAGADILCREPVTP